MVEAARAVQQASTETNATLGWTEALADAVSLPSEHVADWVDVNEVQIEKTERQAEDDNAQH